MFNVSQILSESGIRAKEQLEKIHKTPPGLLTVAEKALSALLKKAAPNIRFEATKKAIKKCKTDNDAVLQAMKNDWVLDQLCSEEYRDLRRYKVVIASAIERNDHDFFVQLGKELRKKPTRYINDLSIFIASHWDNGLFPIFPPFKWFTDDALVDFLKLINPRFSSVTFDQIRKTRQRLGLRKNSKSKIKGLEHKGKYFRYIGVDKG